MIKSSALNYKKAITMVMAFLFLNPIDSFAEEQTTKPIAKNIELYFALGDKHGFPAKEPKTSFECTDKIYAALALRNFKEKRYTISFTWVDPTGEEREKTEYPFTVTEHTTELWSWLSLSRARGAGMIQWINPAAGLEEFIGPWEVEIRINDKKVASKQLEITC